MKKRSTVKGYCSRALALLLSVAMILAMVPAMVFADTAGGQQNSSDKAAKKLLVFGNSTASGYGMPDFLRKNNGFAPNNNYLEEWALDGTYVQDWTDEKAWTLDSALIYNNGLPGMTEQQKEEWEATHPARGRMSTFAFPWQLKKYMVQEEGTDKVDLTALTMDGMRSDDLRAFLDEDYYNSVVEREAAYTDRWFKEHGGTKSPDVVYGFLTSHMNSYIKNFYRGNASTANTYAAAKKFVEDSISEADVIVVDICGNNFGTYLAFRLYAFMGQKEAYAPNTYETLSDVEDIPADVRAKISELQQIAESKVGALQSPFVKQIIDSYLYSVADCIVNFNAYMEGIRKLNPDAKVIAVGLNNPMEGLKVSMGGNEFDLGKLSGAIYDVVNSYMKAVDGNSNYYYYADISDGLETFESVIASADSMEALYADGEEADGLGNYAINKLYSDFVTELLGGEDGDAQAVYSMIQSAVKQAAPGAVFPAWDTLAAGDPVTFDSGSGSMYVTFDTKAEDMMKAFSVSAVSPLPAEEQAAGKTILLKQMITQIADSKVKPAIQKVLYEALRNHQTIDITELQKSFADLDTALSAIKNYMLAVMTGNEDAELDEAYWTMLAIEEKFILGTSIGVHPDAVGCTQKFEAIRDAYDSDKTAYEQTKAEIAAKLADVVEMLRNAGAGDSVDAIIDRLEKIKMAMDMLDAAEPYIDAAVEYEKQFEEVLSQTLGQLGLTTDDLMKMTQDAMESLDSADIQKIAESLKILDECVRKMPETIAQINSIKSKAETIREMLEEAGLLKSNDILDKLKVLAARLDAAETKEDYMKILADLTPLGEELLSIGAAVANLPEYEAAVDEFMYINRTSLSNLEGRMSAAEKQVAQLNARYVDSKFSTKVTFPGNKAKITLSLKTDVLADGYTLKLNGKSVNYTESNGKLIYTVNNAKVGKKYKFELTPFVLYDDEDGVAMLDGKTTTKTVTPKVSLKKVTLKSVKGGKKSVTAKWAKVSGATGYKISLKQGKKTKYVTVKGGSKVSKKITGLTSGKKYTVKVRAYKTVNGKNYYGSWSNAKKAKVK